jgi:hypothetical protein
MAMHRLLTSKPPKSITRSKTHKNPLHTTLKNHKKINFWCPSSWVNPSPKLPRKQILLRHLSPKSQFPFYPYNMTLIPKVPPTVTIITITTPPPRKRRWILPRKPSPCSSSPVHRRMRRRCWEFTVERRTWESIALSSSPVVTELLILLVVMLI